MKIDAEWMRGGTSKCWVFEREQLDIPGYTVDEILLRLFGSPDSRQVDGVGGGTSTTSKAVILSPSQEPDTDVDYTFAQVGIDEGKVDWGSNCGNCSAVVALYAMDRGWVQPQGDETLVRALNTNTQQQIVQRVATAGGKWAPELDTMIPGVPFAGTEVGLGFVEPAGKTTGSLLPTGNESDLLMVDGRAVAVEQHLGSAGPVVDQHLMPGLEHLADHRRRHRELAVPRLLLREEGLVVSPGVGFGEEGASFVLSTAPAGSLQLG